jgi:hypothetical protein
MKPAVAVMAGLVPAIRSGRVPRLMAGTGPAMTMKVTRNGFLVRSGAVPDLIREAISIEERTVMGIAVSLRSSQ